MEAILTRRPDPRSASGAGASSRGRSGTPGPPSLTTGQRRHLEISLRHLHTELGEARAWFAAQPLEREKQARVEAALEALRQKVADVAERLGLSLAEPPPDPAGRLRSWSSHWWTLALDCRADALRGYGEVAPSTAKLVDPLAEELAEALLALGSMELS